MPNIRAVRVISELRRLSEFGRYETGVHRPTYSAEDMAAATQKFPRMEDVGGRG